MLVIFHCIFFISPGQIPVLRVGEGFRFPPLTLVVVIRFCDIKFSIPILSNAKLSYIDWDLHAGFIDEHTDMMHVSINQNQKKVQRQINILSHVAQNFDFIVFWFHTSQVM